MRLCVFTLLRKCGLAHLRLRGKAGQRQCGFGYWQEHSHDDAHHRRRPHMPAGQRPSTGLRAGHRSAALFTPDAHVIWLLASLDPADSDTAHGLIDLGLAMPALGTVKLSGLASIVGTRKQPVMRDRYSLPMRRLSEYLRMAEENGAIPD